MLNGVQEAEGSNPLTPTSFRVVVFDGSDLFFFLFSSIYSLIIPNVML